MVVVTGPWIQVKLKLDGVKLCVVLQFLLALLMVCVGTN